MPDFGPTLPLIILGQVPSTSGADNIMAALKRSDRMRAIGLYVPGSQLANVLEGVREPFPELADLLLTMMKRCQSFPIHPGVNLPHASRCHSPLPVVASRESQAM
jgi:hypothetical protein